MTSGQVQTELINRSITDDIIRNIISIWEECDLIRFAPSKSKKINIETTINKIEEIINSLEKKL